MSRRIRQLLTVALLFLPLGAVAQRATDILDKAATVYEQSGGISVRFALHTRSEMQQFAESFEGIMQMRGDKFTLETPDASIWYDGKTQWVYMERNEEVNVSEPTGEELETTNPAILLNAYKKGYNASLKGESTAVSGKAAYDIELTPKKKGDILKVTLQIEKTTHLPARITMESKNKLFTTIQINELKTGINQPDAAFSFDQTKYPDAEVIDLR
ncbi:LolA-like putative outer membrane lipoprotein chaperone [Parabacteroides sp. PF5-9]|uniref:LolA-like putative outer membrane lipoprotein chaperone n=1 Tax=Parabacteroides sp. PF5-9 TaxID=1742404 RepID=UPI002475B3A8|nr:LolA-like putative outer membrane lipoprotein chaperone [Parabacteroides sp. PF5-9]MDH6357170.1 outer membrane lipoprotein-sorting protein [Parabacteroides sp. PF5-9]